MSFKVVKRMPDGRIKYAIDEWRKGVRYRERITCFPSDIREKYRSWLKELEYKIERSKHPEKYLYACLREYLESAKIFKSTKRYNEDVRFINLFITYQPDIPMIELSKRHILQYKNWRSTHTFRREKGKYFDEIIQGNVSPATVKKSIMTLSAFFNWAINMEYIPINPASNIRFPANNRIVVDLTIDQFHELQDKANEYQFRYIFVELMVPLRRSAICHLKWSDIDWANGVISISKDNAKNKRDSTVTMPSDLIHYLSEVRKKEIHTEFVINYKGNPIKDFKTSWLSLRKKLSFGTLPNGKKLRFHDLRHAVANFMLKSGTPMEDIQKQLTHTDIRTTQIYAQHLVHADRDKISVVSGLVAKKKSKAM